MSELSYQNAGDARREIRADWRRRLFGPPLEEVWKRLAQEIGARHEPGRWWKNGRVVAAHGPWQMTLDTYMVDKVVFTRLRAPFVNPGGFRFCVYRRSVFSGIGKLLGVQDIVVGEARFDDAFIIQANDEARVRALLRDPQLRALIDAQPRIALEVRDDEGWFGKKFPPATDELRFSTPGTIKDLDRLRNLFELFVVTLNRLCEIGTASDAPPGVEL